MSLLYCPRNQEMFGDDAHMFNPERWLRKEADDKKALSLGVYGNLYDFHLRTCLSLSDSKCMSD
jgi:hypothetical protein